MDIRQLHNDDDHAWALREVEASFDAAPGTQAGERLDVLVTLIEAYEAKHQSIGLPHPIEAIKARMSEKGFNQRYLASLTRIPESKISEVLSEKRALSLYMIRHISGVLNLPIELLVQPYGVTDREFVDA